MWRIDVLGEQEAIYSDREVTYTEDDRDQQPYYSVEYPKGFEVLGSLVKDDYAHTYHDGHNCMVFFLPKSAFPYVKVVVKRGLVIER